MSRPVKMAFGGTVATVVFALPMTGVIAFYSGGAGAFSFGYGVVVGLVAFVSIAVAASLMISGEPSERKLALGFGVYMARLMFAAAALGIPMIAGSWPILPMVGGVVGVYIVESAAVLVAAAKVSGEMRIHNLQEVREAGDMERRVI